MVNAKIKGPRLNQTKVERASVVYGKDNRLHWRVTPPMPKLLVRIVFACMLHARTYLYCSGKLLGRMLMYMYVLNITYATRLIACILICTLTAS